MHPLDKIIAMLNNTTGRDKLCRWLQYFSKFLSNFLITSMLLGKNTKQISARIASLGANLSLTRKVLRFGRPIQVGKDLLGKLEKGEVQGFGIFRFLGAISLGLYFLSDHLMYFHKIGLKKFKEPFFGKLSQFVEYMWLSECIWTIIADGAALYDIQSQMASLKHAGGGRRQEEDSQKGMRAEMQKLKFQNALVLSNFVKCVIDAFIAMSLLKIIKFLPDWLTGLMGTVTSSISIATIWAKTK